MRLCALAFLTLCNLHQLGCTGSDPGTCSYSGRGYHVGDTFPSEDGCNSCSCVAGGGVACTERACLSDGGTRTDGGDLIMCAGPTPSFPSFDKTCTGTADCVIGIHQTNCCGATKAIGINQAEKARFTTDEQICEGQYPPCACAATPTVAEDGQIASATTKIVVECQANKCMTLVK